MTQAKQLVETIVKGIQEKKGSRITVVDLSKIDGAIANYFVICQGSSPTQVEAIAESVGEFALKELHEKPMNVIGLGAAQWVAMDFSDVIVHIFLPETREFYNLDGLWEDADSEQIPDLD